MQNLRAAMELSQDCAGTPASSGYILQARLCLRASLCDRMRMGHGVASEPVPELAHYTFCSWARLASMTESGAMDTIPLAF